ncbi:MAG: phytanoyl-CoA dioxygenase family protein [Paracoccaceae bacterium]
MPIPSLQHTLKTQGRVWLRQALGQTDLATFDAAPDVESRPGARLGFLPALSGDAPISRLIQSLLPSARATRAVFFNKTAQSNWGVPWHQDRIIAVQARHDVPGYDNWSEKSGQWHCEPPLALLDKMLFVRLHLDPTDADNGAMEIAVGSHREGAVPAAKAEARAARYETEVCAAERGDILILNMLTLHRSRPATTANSRRTLRIDYSADTLPAPLAWAF